MTRRNTKTPSDTAKATRLRAEAAFQTGRVVSEEREARDRFYYLAAPAFARYHAELAALRDKRVLVVGCSEGGISPLARAGNQVTGIDICEEAIVRSKAMLVREGLEDRAEALVMNGEEVAFRDATFDVIVMSGVLHHLDVPNACRSWRRVLKPGGRVLMLEPMAWNPVVALYRLLTPSMRTDDEHPLVPSDFATLREHFETVECEAFAGLTLLSLPFAYIPGMRRVRDLVFRLLTPVDRVLFRVVPFLRYFGWTSYIRCVKTP